jgi:hypothetical protein
MRKRSTFRDGCRSITTVLSDRPGTASAVENGERCRTNADTINDDDEDVNDDDGNNGGKGDGGPERRENAVLLARTSARARGPARRVRMELSIIIEDCGTRARRRAFIKEYRTSSEN